MADAGANSPLPPATWRSVGGAVGLRWRFCVGVAAPAGLGGAGFRWRCPGRFRSRRQGCSASDCRGRPRLLAALGGRSAVLLGWAPLRWGVAALRRRWSRRCSRCYSSRRWREVALGWGAAGVAGLWSRRWVVRLWRGAAAAGPSPVPVAALADLRLVAGCFADLADLWSRRWSGAPLAALSGAAGPPVSSMLFL